MGKTNILSRLFLKPLIQLKRSKEREQQAKILNAVNTMATVLLSAKNNEAFETSLPDGMKLMAECMDLDRIRIWQNFLINGILHFKLTSEWIAVSERTGAHVHSGVMHSYPDDAPNWFSDFWRDKHICGPAAQMKAEEKALPEYTGIKSILAIPEYLHGFFWGFVSFDNSRYECEYSQEDISILRSASLIMASAINRNLMTLDLHEAVNQANTANRTKSEFLANMSHEIRTPMNSIIGFSELALDGEISIKTRDYLEKIIENSIWLLELINDILDISKIESGKMDLENIPFDLDEILTACQTAVMPKASEKELTMSFYAQPLPGKRLHGDPLKLRQILMNLLSNAVKFTTAGTIDVQAVIKRFERNRVSIQFEVSDTGIGISEEQLKNIFDPFIQAESGTTRKYGGSGLGLPITKNIIEMMGGLLHVDSTPGVGSKFRFELGFNTTNTDDDQGVIKPADFEPLEKPLFSGEVLLCEDNVMNQQVICEHLLRVGLKTVVAENGKIGVDYVKEKTGKRFDLILMDIYMPVMDGIEATSQILEFDPDIPIVAMTANVMADDRDIYYSKGMKDIVGKPFTSQELWRCLMKYLQPVEMKHEDVSVHLLADKELHQRLIKSFLRNNAGIMDRIKNALEEQDVKLAHRLAHTLKSNAAQLDKTALQKAAMTIKNQLKTGVDYVTPEQLEVLDKELNIIFNAFKKMTEKSTSPAEPQETVDTTEALKLLDELEPMIKDNNFASLSYINILRSVQGSESLAENIENLDFRLAMESLTRLREKISGGE